MGKIHGLKCNIKFYHDLLDGVKKAEFRNNDRNFKVGDVIAFLWVNESGKVLSEYTTFTKEITHITNHDDLDIIPKGYVIISLE